jgi:hypothetical protein
LSQEQRRPTAIAGGRLDAFTNDGRHVDGVHVERREGFRQHRDARSDRKRFVDQDERAATDSAEPSARPKLALERLDSQLDIEARRHALQLG